MKIKELAEKCKERVIECDDCPYTEECEIFTETIEGMSPSGIVDFVEKNKSITEDKNDNVQILEVLDRVWNYCEEIDNNLPESERTGYKMTEDMMLLRDYISSSTKVVHGHWICENLGFGTYRYICSECGSIYGQDQIEEFKHSKFCGDCGAKMS